MDVLRTWIITLVSITILCTVIEKFAPQGSMNKYVRLICGLAVTVVIALPVLNFLKGEFSLDKLAWSDYMKLSEGELKKRIERIEGEDSRYMLEIYRESLINDIKSRFRGEERFAVTAVDAVLYEDAADERFGMIRTLYLTLEPGRGNLSGTIDSVTVEMIKNQLSQIFAIDRDQIIIDLSR